MKYKPAYCQKLVDYFDIEPYYEKAIKGKGRDGKEYIVKYTTVANDLPLLSGFAKSIDIASETVSRWGRKHKEFGQALKKAKDSQKRILVTNGLKGYYDRTFAIFTAKNVTDMRDVKEHDIKGDFSISFHESLKQNGRTKTV